MKRLMGERSALGSSIVAAVPHPSISTQLVVFADMCAFISTESLYHGLAAHAMMMASTRNDA